MPDTTNTAGRGVWTALLCAIAVLVAVPAMAASGAIVGLNTGQSNLQGFRHPTSVSEDDEIVVQAFGGYQFLTYYAVAGGWQRFVDVGDRQTTEHENDYDLILAGVTYHFGK